MVREYSYDDGAASASGSQSVRWNGIALAGRQLLIILFSLILARILGPSNYGIVAQAAVYVTFTSLLLDQGITSALIARRRVGTTLLGASMSLNLLVAVGLAAVTLPLAPYIAEWLRTPELSIILPVLAGSLLFKAAAVVPRMLLLRSLRFRALAIAEVGSALVSGLLAVFAAFGGWQYWSIVLQYVVSDVVLLLVLVVAARPPAPNLRFGELSTIIGFGWRVFLGDLLGFASRNLDTVLVGRYLGETQVGFYSLAYRVLLTPIQMVGQAVSRVLFPIVARERARRDYVAAILIRCARDVSMVAFPVMAYIAVSSWDSISLFLGSAWLPAAPVLAILAITGARQAVTSMNAPVVLGFGRADIQLRFSIAAAVMQIAGIVGGLPFGIVGVATGYTIAGFVLTPVILLIQRNLAGVSLRRQLSAMGPALHASVWAAAAYVGLYLIELSALVRMLGGAVAGLAIYAIILVLFHRVSLKATWTDLRRIVVSRRA